MYAGLMVIKVSPSTVVLRELDGALLPGRLQALVHLSVLVANPDRVTLTQPYLR